MTLALALLCNVAALNECTYVRTVYILCILLCCGKASVYYSCVCVDVQVGSAARTNCAMVHINVMMYNLCIYVQFCTGSDLGLIKNIVYCMLPRYCVGVEIPLM